MTGTDKLIVIMGSANIATVILVAVLAFMAGRGNVPRWWRAKVQRLDTDLDTVFKAIRAHKQYIDDLKLQVRGEHTGRGSGKHHHTEQIPIVPDSIEGGANAPQ